MLATNAPMFRGNQLAAAVYLGTRRLWARPETLSLDFAADQYKMGGIAELPATRQFSDLITFTRASGGGRFNAAGQYEWLPANQPRIDYDPVTGEAKGLLIEEQRTNLLTYSELLTDASWLKDFSSDALAPAVSSEGQLFGVPAFRVKFTPNTGNSNLRKPINLSSGQVYTLSCFIQSLSGTQSVNLNLSGLGADVVVGTTPIRVSVPVTWSAATGGWSFNIRQGAANLRTTGEFLITGAQLEAGSSPSSYIPTTTAQVTRAADVASVNVLSPWFNASEGTLFVEASTRNTSYATIAQLSDGTANNEFRLIGWNDGSNRFSVVASGNGLSPTLNGPAEWVPRNDTPFKLAASWGAGEFAYAGKGAAPTVRVSALNPTGLNRLNLGFSSSGGFRLNGHVRSIRFYPRRLSNTEIQAMTA